MACHGCTVGSVVCNSVLAINFWFLCSLLLLLSILVDLSAASARSLFVYYAQTQSNHHGSLMFMCTGGSPTVSLRRFGGTTIIVQITGRFRFPRPARPSCRRAWYYCLVLSSVLTAVRLGRVSVDFESTFAHHVLPQSRELSWSHRLGENVSQILR